jgi:uncharacterized protein (DUF2141 family)
MRFTLTIETENDTFVDEEADEVTRRNHAIADVLRQLSLDFVEVPPDHYGAGVVRDANGNRVGGWEVMDKWGPE